MKAVFFDFNPTTLAEAERKSTSKEPVAVLFSNDKLVSGSTPSSDLSLPFGVTVYDPRQSIPDLVQHANIAEALNSIDAPVVWIDSRGHTFCQAVMLYLTSIPNRLFTEIEVTETMRSKHNFDHLAKSGGFILFSAQESTVLYRPRHDEEQYKDLVRTIMCVGEKRQDRTGTGTYSVFGHQMRFSLKNNTMPLLTTKRTYWKGVYEELLWFVAGDTDSHNLERKKVKIWVGNGTREFLDSRGLTENEEGMLGPIYGHQWRNFNGPYCGKRQRREKKEQEVKIDDEKDDKGEREEEEEEKKGIDQLQECVDLLRNSPNTRRCLMVAWNPAQLHEMALPPCHVLCQFSVRQGRYLVAHLYQRSADVGLGVPFNIASYALLTHMMAHVAGYEAAELIVSLGDAHLYKDHISPLNEARFLERSPFTFPTLEILREKGCSIDAFDSGDFKLHNYESHPTIKLPFSA